MSYILTKAVAVEATPDCPLQVVDHNRGICGLLEEHYLQKEVYGKMEKILHQLPLLLRTYH
jgi:hypothetical protein